MLLSYWNNTVKNRHFFISPLPVALPPCRVAATVKGSSKKPSTIPMHRIAVLLSSITTDESLRKPTSIAGADKVH